MMSLKHLRMGQQWWAWQNNIKQTVYWRTKGICCRYRNTMFQKGKERPNKRRKKWHSKSEVANVAPAGRFCQKFSEKFRQFYKPLIFIRSQAWSDRNDVSKFWNAVSKEWSPTCEYRNGTSADGLSKFFNIFLIHTIHAWDWVTRRHEMPQIDLRSGTVTVESHLNW